MLKQKLLSEYRLRWGVRWVSTVVLGSMQEVQGRERELWLTVGRISTCPHINSYYYWIKSINLYLSTNDETIGLAGQIASFTHSFVNPATPGLAGPQLRRLAHWLRASKPATTARYIPVQASACRGKWP